MDIDSSYDQFDSNMASCSSMDPDWQIPKVEFSHGNQDSSVLKRFVRIFIYTLPDLNKKKKIIFLNV